MAENPQVSRSSSRGEMVLSEPLGEKLSENVSRALVALVWGAAGPNRENLHRWSQGKVYGHIFLWFRALTAFRVCRVRL